MTFMDIIHRGTKYSIVPGNDEEDNVISFTNNMFLSIYQKIFSCQVCGSSISHHWVSRMLNILPINGCSIEQLIQKNLSLVVHKNCTVCQTDTEHNESLKWICLPRYLVLAINRFSYVGNRTVKSNLCIPVQTQITVDATYFELVSIMHHHGNGAGSGHYTSTLFHDDKVFDCNDMMIIESSSYQLADSATSYMMVYCQK